MFLHLAEADHPDARLRRLGTEVLEAALGGNAEEELLAVLEEADGAPLGQAEARLGAEGAGEVGKLGEAEAGQRLGHLAEDLVRPPRGADGPPAREALGRRLGALGRAPAGERGRGR